MHGRADGCDSPRMDCPEHKTKHSPTGLEIVEPEEQIEVPPHHSTVIGVEYRDRW